MAEVTIGDEFWSDWERRFHNNAGTYITPDAPRVTSEIKSNIPTQDKRNQSVRRAWRWIADNIDYALSKEWKTPTETLNEGKGDCEDVDFLMGSFLPHIGVNHYQLRIGYLHHKHRSREAHTWLRIDGMICDPTAHPSDIVGHQYETKRTINIHVD